MSEIKKIKVAGSEYGIADEANRAELQKLRNATDINTEKITDEINRAKNAENEIKSKALHYNTLHAVSTADAVQLGGKSVDGTNTLSVDIPAATEETAGVMSAEDKTNLENSINKINVLQDDKTASISFTQNDNTIGTATITPVTYQKAGLMTPSYKMKLENLASVVSNTDLNVYTDPGVYKLDNATNTSNFPINTPDHSSFRLTVLGAYDGNTEVRFQVLTLLNHAGGEGNIYIRSQQNGEWKPWGKLQTNVEVGQITPDGMSNLIDNGIYSGVCVDGTTVETFVLIVINNYLAAAQAGFGSYVSQLKYSIDLNRGNTVKTRTRDAYGMWNDWSEIGGSTYKLPEATQDTLGGVKLGKVTSNMYAPLVNIGTSEGGGVGIAIDSSILMNEGQGITINYNNTLTNSLCSDYKLSVRLGTGDGIAPFNGLIIPCVIGTGSPSDDSKWRVPSVGIPYNKKQFCLKVNGLNLVDGIASGVTKVTWDANSNMNDYVEPGIYDIYGERTVKTDNLPIMNDGSGHSIAARLTVIASTLQPDNTEKCVTQFLQLSNRMGGEGNTYIRTYNENNNGLNGWSPWKKQQGMVETYINTDSTSITLEGVTLGTVTEVGGGLNGMTDNGMYSGIYTNDLTLTSPRFVETFVLVVINDYAVSSQAGTTRRISQLKYATDTLTGECTVKKRVYTGDDPVGSPQYWSQWEEIGSNKVIDITDAVKTYGLPTLIAQGLAKEGVTYKVVCEAGEVPSIDNNGKISTHIDNHRSNVDDIVTMLIKVQKKASNDRYTVFIDCTIVGGVKSYLYKYVISFINDSDETVQVSADMTEL